MNNAEFINLINEKRDSIIEALKSAEESALRNTECEYRVYIDSDGETGIEEWLAGDNGWYEFRDGYDRVYIRAFCHEYYSILWDWWFDDSSAAESAFREKFGFAVEEDEGEPLSYNMQRTALAHGVSAADFDAWLASETEDAISEMISDADADDDYDRLVDDAIDNLSEI